MTLSPEQLLRFSTDGYLVLPNLVPQATLDTALRLINHSLGQGSTSDEAKTAQSITSAPELVESAAITALLDPCLSSINALIGGEQPAIKPKRAQIALRFPQLDDEVAEPTAHLDGRPLGTNCVHEYTNFSLLVGVFLKPVTAPNQGNLVVWPGSHRRYEDYFRAHGTAGITAGVMPDIDLGLPHHVQANAGDVVLAHYQLGHGVAAHTGPDIRYGVYFRMKHAEHDARQLACLTDLWLDYPTLADATS